MADRMLDPRCTDRPSGKAMLQCAKSLRILLSIADPASYDALGPWRGVRSLWRQYLLSGEGGLPGAVVEEAADADRGVISAEHLGEALSLELESMGEGAVEPGGGGGYLPEKVALPGPSSRKLRMPTVGVVGAEHLDEALGLEVERRRRGSRRAHRRSPAWRCPWRRPRPLASEPAHSSAWSSTSSAGDDAVDEPDGERLVGAHVAAAPDQLLGAWRGRSAASRAACHRHPGRCRAGSRGSRGGRNRRRRAGRTPAPAPARRRARTR